MTATTSDTLGLTFRYNATTNTYSLSGGGKSASFGMAQFEGYDNLGDAHFARNTGNDGFDRLTLFNPDRLGSGTRYVTAGLWQRRTSGASATANSSFEFDSFVYGFPTAAAGVPRSGSATYDIDLFAVASPVGNFPRSVIGSGTFSLDFGQGLFAMAGEAGEYNNDVDYSSCCAAWRGSGYLSSSGGLTGNFAYAGRDRHNYQARISGALFGPAGSEVGGSLIGGDGGEATFSGIFAGTRERSGIDVSLHVLGEGNRSFYAGQNFTATLQSPGEPGLTGSSPYFPSTGGKITFADDRSVTYDPGITDERFAQVTFTQANLVASRSDSRITSYETNTANGNYQLELSRPGAGNPEIALTYSSFGHWQETRVSATGRQMLSMWFSYGVPTGDGTLPATGTARYSTIVRGSGERHSDAARLTVSGTSSIDIDFAAQKVTGTFDASALTATNERVALPKLTFSNILQSNGFFAYLETTPGQAPGSISGRLYGPGGEEIGGSFDLITRVTEGGAVDATYAGVFYGKRD